MLCCTFGFLQEYIQALYERCLVATANYGQFWVRYAKWLRKSFPDGIQQATGVMKRAADVFVPKRPEVLLLLAMLYEESGNVNSSREVYQKAEDLTRRLVVEVVESHASFERRQGNEQRAREVFEEAISRAAGKQDDKPQSFAEMKTSFFAMQYLLVSYARFVSYKDPVHASELAKQGIVRDNGKYVSRELWQIYFNSTERSNANFEDVANAYKQALLPKEKEDIQVNEETEVQETSAEGSVDFADESQMTLQAAAEKLSGKDRAILWLRYLDFCKVSCNSVSQLLEAEEQFEQYKIHQGGLSDIDAVMKGGGDTSNGTAGGGSGVLPPSASSGSVGGKRGLESGASNGGYSRPAKMRRGGR